MDRTISSFLQHLVVEKGFSRNTSDAYRNDLGQFWEFIQDNGHNASGDKGNGNGHSNGNGNGNGHSKSSNGSFTWSTVDINVLN
ncbi:MAG TPA: hypothetical protein DIT90_06075, partial [Dehalococcoidia bacterium]|nr:hypothetical protein [Dehalococcoidia bacterium]